MKIAIMQPYFLPYIGYWQLINSVDIFVIYDNIQYTKSGWINRNRLLQNNNAKTFSIPLKKDESFKNVNERFLSEDFDKKHLLFVIRNSYYKAPYFKENFSLIEEIINYKNKNLFEYILFSVQSVCQKLGISTPIRISSTLDINHSLKGKDKVIEICKFLGADNYINPIGGVELYDKKEFENAGIKLNFLKTEGVFYKQYNNDFVENLSILDVMMFNNSNKLEKLLESYILR